MIDDKKFISQPFTTHKNFSVARWVQEQYMFVRKKTFRVVFNDLRTLFGLL